MSASRIAPQTEQNLILSFVRSLYPAYQENGHSDELDGTCVGVSALAAIAFLTNTIEAFEERISFLSKNRGIKIDDIQDEARRNDLKEFFDDFELLQNPDDYPERFDISASLNQHHLPALSLVASKYTKGKGDINFLPPFTSVSTKKELDIFLGCLSGYIYLSTSLQQITFMAFSNSHAVTIHFNPDVELCWSLLNVRHPEIKVQRCASTSSLSSALYSTLDGGDVCIFSTYVFTIGTSANQVSNIVEAWRKPNVNILQLTPEKACAKDNDNASWLVVEILRGNSSKVGELLSHGAKAVINDRRNRGGDTPLSLAVVFGYQDIVDMLLTAGALPDKSRTHQDMTPLMIAAYKGYHYIVRALLAWGANPNIQREQDKETALYLACERAQCAVVDVLLDHPNINASLTCPVKVDDEDFILSPLLIAVRNYNCSQSELENRNTLAIINRLLVHFAKKQEKVPDETQQVMQAIFASKPNIIQFFSPNIHNNATHPEQQKPTASMALTNF